VGRDEVGGEKSLLARNSENGKVGGSRNVLRHGSDPPVLVNLVCLGKLWGEKKRGSFAGHTPLEPGSACVGVVGTSSPSGPPQIQTREEW